MDFWDFNKHNTDLYFIRGSSTWKIRKISLFEIVTRAIDVVGWLRSNVTPCLVEWWFRNKTYEWRLSLLVELECPGLLRVPDIEGSQCSLQKQIVKHCHLTCNKGHTRGGKGCINARSKASSWPLMGPPGTTTLNNKAGSYVTRC